LNVYSWIENRSSPEQTDGNLPQGRPFGFASNATTIPRLAAAAVRPDLEALVSEILRRDGELIEDFLSKLLATYETIVAAFDAGDRVMLRRLVSPEVYDALSGAIAARESRGITVETVFSRIATPEVVDGLIGEDHMEISVRFVGECFKLWRNPAGELIDGATDRSRNIDIWTFARMLSSREDAWRVVATEADA
jgi:predicted lipid-binding transport protein (Tim44 family)